MKKEKKEKKDSSEKIQRFKKRWLVSSLNTAILIAIMVAIFVAINFAVKKIDPTPIDFTTSKDYTLTDQSKERVKNIEQDVNIYFVGFEEGSVEYKLAKQYNKANSKIKVELVDATKNQEIAKKYSASNEDPTVIVESGKKSKKISSYDLVSYDSATYKEVSVAEQKITSAILNLTSGKTPKAYFLTGYTDFSLTTNLTSFAKYLDDEVLTYETINLLNKQKVPDDCDTLIIMTPTKDFDQVTTNAILEYIKKGGNILWFNGLYEEEKEFTNVNKILAEYGVKKFEKGMIYETDKNKIFGSPVSFAPDIEENEILTNVKQSEGTVFFTATKINIDEDKLESLNVEETDLLLASEKSYFTKDLTGANNGKGDQKGSFIVGAQLVKTLKEAKKAEDGAEEEKAQTSTLIIYGNDYFISDFPIQIGNNQIPVISLFNNADVALNSIAYLADNYEEITIRKGYSDSQTTFTPTEQEKIIITVIIFAVPVLIIIAGVVVWIIRRHRK